MRRGSCRALPARAQLREGLARSRQGQAQRVVGVERDAKACEASDCLGGCGDWGASVGEVGDSPGVGVPGHSTDGAKA